MEKNFFKIITVFIVMLLCIDNVKAQVGYAELTDNDDLDGTGKTLTFKSDDSKPDGTLPLYTTDGEPSWYSERENITTVVFDPSFANCKPTSCANWFRGMKKLTSISGMKNYLNTENVKFMGAMFYECSALTGELDLSGFNTSNVTDMGHMFYWCSQLTNVKFGENFKTGSVTDMSYMFFECRELTGELDLSGFNTSSVTNMYGMFYKCSKLTNIKFGENFKTGSVTNMSWMFVSCSSLTGELDLSGFNTSNVIYMEALFTSCSQLTNIKFGENFKTGSVKDMGSMFSGCSSLTGELDLSGFNTASVQDMSYMFANCSQLTNIKFGENFKTGSVTNMSNMFASCQGLKSLDLSGFNTESVIYMNLMYYCNNLTSIKVGEDWKTDQVSNSYNMFYDCRSLIGNGGEWVTGATDATNANTSSTGYLTKDNYKVFLDPDGGTVTGGNVINLTAEKTTLPEPTKTGHQFLGWTRQLTSSTFESSTTTLVTVAADEGNKKYKAQWTLMKYPVKFHYDETSVISETSVAYNSLITPAPFPDGKKGYKCLSWNPSLTYPLSWDFQNQTLNDVALTFFGVRRCAAFLSDLGANQNRRHKNLTKFCRQSV